MSESCHRVSSHRELPSWMTKNKGKEKEPLKSQRKRKAARAIFYCMNEKELVEAAVSFLTNGEDVAILADHKIADGPGGTTVKIREKPASSKTKAEAVEEESSDCRDAQEMAYVSETDYDITEMERVPYTKSPQYQRPEGQRSGPLQDHSGLRITDPEAKKRQQHSQMPADTTEEEDDALRLVQEIFFT